MSLYPQWKPDAHPADHLLFDLGYSYATLVQAEQLLKELRECFFEGDRFLERIDNLLARMKSLREGRMQIRSEIFDAAAQVAKRDEQH